MAAPEVDEEIDIIDDEHLNALLSFPPDVQQAIEQVRWHIRSVLCF